MIEVTEGAVGVLPIPNISPWNRHLSITPTVATGNGGAVHDGFHGDSATHDLRSVRRYR